MRIIDRFWRDRRGSMVAEVAKVAAAIGFLSVLAAQFISTQTAKLDTERMSQVASAASRGQPVDPMITGSIAGKAAQTKLDPCSLR